MNRCGSMLISARRIPAAIAGLLASFSYWNPAFYTIGAAGPGNVFIISWRSREGAAGTALDLTHPDTTDAPAYFDTPTQGMYGGPGCDTLQIIQDAIASGAYAWVAPVAFIFRTRIDFSSNQFPYLMDGVGAVNTMAVRQKNTDDTLEMFTDNSGVPVMSCGDATACQIDLGTYHTRRIEFNGASSKADRDGKGEVTGDSGVLAASGMTLFNVADQNGHSMGQTTDGFYVWNHAFTQPESLWFQSCLLNRRAPP